MHHPKTGSPQFIPPLKGDGNGVFRVQVVGNCGVGKESPSICIRDIADTQTTKQSTLASELAEILSVPVIHLDRLFWSPGWVETPIGEFRDGLRALLSNDHCKRGWVVDGDYSKQLKGELRDVTDIIWLDSPFLLYFPRLIKRTLQRAFGFDSPCSPGCEESMREAFLSKKSILWLAISQHMFAKRKEQQRLLEDGIQIGGRARRVGGWGSELHDWKRRTIEMTKNKQTRE